MADVQPTQQSLRILMLPWLAHGHISPFLELAKKLSTNSPNISIHLCSTPANLKSLNVDSKSFPRIHLTELHLPSAGNNLPPPIQTTKNLPSHLMPALNRLRPIRPFLLRPPRLSLPSPPHLRLPPAMGASRRLHPSHPRHPLPPHRLLRHRPLLPPPPPPAAARAIPLFAKAE